MREGPGQKTCAKSVGVMNLFICTWNIAEADGISLFKGVEIAYDMLASTDSHFEVLLIPEKIVRVQKCVADERCPYDRWQAFRQIKTPRLIVEVVPPASS